MNERNQQYGCSEAAYTCIRSLSGPASKWAGYIDQRDLLLELLLEDGHHEGVLDIDDLVLVLLAVLGTGEPATNLSLTWNRGASMHDLGAFVGLALASVR